MRAGGQGRAGGTPPARAEDGRASGTNRGLASGLFAPPKARASRCLVRFGALPRPAWSLRLGPSKECNPQPEQVGSGCSGLRYVAPSRRYDNTLATRRASFAHAALPHPRGTSHAPQLGHPRLTARFFVVQSRNSVPADCACACVPWRTRRRTRRACSTTTTTRRRSARHHR